MRTSTFYPIHRVSTRVGVRTIRSLRWPCRSRDPRSGGTCGQERQAHGLRREPRTPFEYLFKTPLNTSRVSLQTFCPNCLQYFLQMYCYSTLPYSLLCLWLFPSIICLSVWCYSLIILNCYKACLQLNIFMNCPSRPMFVTTCSTESKVGTSMATVDWPENIVRATMRHREFKDVLLSNRICSKLLKYE